MNWRNDDLAIAVLIVFFGAVFPMVALSISENSWLIVLATLSGLLSPCAILLRE